MPTYDKERLREEFPIVEQSISEIGAIIGKCVPPGWGYALLGFSFGPKGYMTYVSNAHRTDMIAALKEMIEVLEGGKDSPHGVIGQKD